MKTQLTILVAILFFSCNLFAQDSIARKKDITIGFGLTSNLYTNFPTKSFNLTYRHELNNRLMLKGGVSADYLTSSYQSFSKPIYVSDTLLILGEGKTNQNQFSGRLGFDYQVTNIFYAGAELKLGQSRRINSTRTNGFSKDPNSGYWENCYECVSEFFGDETIESKEIDASQTYPTGRIRHTSNKVLNYGILFNVGLDFPLNEHFNFALQGTFETLFYNEGNPFANVQTPVSCNLLLRYRI